MASATLPRTTVVGGANLDITGSCFGRLVPGDSNPGIVKNSPGGVGRNIAENLQRLGHTCSLVSTVGQDIGRTIILDNCQQSGINCDYVFVHPELSSGTYLAVNNQLGALLAAISDMAIIDTLLPELLSKALPAFNQAEQLVIEANLPEESLLWLCGQVENISIHADAVSASKAPRLRRILSQIDILKVNRFEAAAILNLQGDDYFLAEQLYQRGVKQVLLSQGPQGAILHNSTGIIHRDAIKGLNENDTGAGDALLSGFICAQQLLNDEQDQLEFAIACATFTLNSSASVNPLLSVETIRSEYLRHLPQSAWRS